MLGGLIDLLWPQVCPVCDREVSGQMSGQMRVHPGCLDRIALARRSPGTGTPVVAHFEDGPDWFRILHQWKYGGESGLASVVAARMFLERPAGIERAVLVPLPDDPARRLERGFSPVADLATELAARLTLPVDPSLLRRRRSIASQTRCPDDAGRRVNVVGAFRSGDLARWPIGMSLVLVEDQVTSGSTIAEAVPLLRARGARVLVWCAARAARAPRWLA